ncbi:hypothetical protein RIF29_15429 [Crotalaria pallida]|uniref:Uncharacterized protein n=1 Tax=Crotalaria pallida TaxID=3830 RepID=A0AAN9IDK4_CROPI
MEEGSSVKIHSICREVHSMDDHIHYSHTLFTYNTQYSHTPINSQTHKKTHDLPLSQALHLHSLSLHPPSISLQRRSHSVVRSPSATISFRHDLPPPSIFDPATAFDRAPTAFDPAPTHLHGLPPSLFRSSISNRSSVLSFVLLIFDPATAFDPTSI